MRGVNMEISINLVNCLLSIWLASVHCRKQANYLLASCLKWWEKIWILAHRSFLANKLLLLKAPQREFTMTVVTGNLENAMEICRSLIFFSSSMFFIQTLWNVTGKPRTEDREPWIQIFERKLFAVLIQALLMKNTQINVHFWGGLATKT